MSNAENAVAARLEADRRGLLDLSLRNPLLNYLPRARGLEIVGESATQVFQVLVRDRKRMTFQALAAGEAAKPAIPTATPDDAGRVVASQTDLKLQTALAASLLQSRLLATYYAARTAIEEQGVNTLFLALGMLRWCESDAPGHVLRAPLVLVPAELERSNARDRFGLRGSDEDPEVNLSLSEKLRADAGILLPDRPESEDLDVAGYFDAVAEAVAGRDGWGVERDAIVLGFFSFGKFLMYRDLDEEVWPEASRPSRHPILRALLADGFRDDGAAIDDDEPLDPHLAPADSHMVVDADSTQSLAILDVNQGRNLLIQGPPGTGKSQTIANLIAEALGRDRTVLFVSEKMAALEVVKRRLDRVGLGDACLELHSQKASKKALLEELKRTLALGRPKLAEADEDFRILVATRDRLNAYCDAVNAPIGESGVTPYEAFGALLRLRGRRVEAAPRPLEIDGIAGWSRYDLRRRQELVEELEARLGAVGIPAEHPFWGCRRTVLLPTEGDRLRDLFASARRAIGTLRDSASGLAARLQLPPARSVAEAESLLRTARKVAKAPHFFGVDLGRGEWLVARAEIQEVIESGKALAELHQRHDANLLPVAWDADLLETRGLLNQHGRSHWRYFVPAHHAARRRLAMLCRGAIPTTLDKQLELIDVVIDAQAKRDVIRRHTSLAASLFADRWEGERSNWAKLDQQLKWVIQIHQDIRAGRLPSSVIGALGQAQGPGISDAELNAVKEGVADHRNSLRKVAEFLNLDPPMRGQEEKGLELRDFDEQDALLVRWEGRIEALSGLVGFNHLAERCRADGLGAVVAIAESWPGASRHLVDLFQRHWYERLLGDAFRDRPALAGFDGHGQEHSLRTFRELDRRALRHNRGRLALKHWQGLPRRDGGGQLAVLRREFEKKARHLPVRLLLSRAGDAVRAIKPVFMMSPLSVAGHLAPGTLPFDLVIFDEASQVKPVEALGAILRGKQVVVVGDSQQLPPTRFFERLTGEEDDDEETTGEVESILGLFASQGAPQRLLRWHYRSRHESLIAVSNREFYGDRLIVFPSPDAARRDSGLVVRHLPRAVYDRGRTRTNPDEAEAIARAVFQFAAEQEGLPANRRSTLGVVAFSVPQTDAIRDQIERLRRDDPAREWFFADNVAEPFFVKNLENVQGDERDQIFISIGYGQDAAGDLAMNFGPLNADGGERRLNVLITRARVRCEVFTGLTAGEIDLNRTSARGVQALKVFLAAAEGKPPEAAASPATTAERGDEPAFEDAVGAALLAAGHRIRRRIGATGMGLDLAVLDPEREGRYLLGITTDGPSYREPRTARDRDRLRTQVLESLGWRLLRIWSTDWVRNPDGEARKLLAAVAGATEATSPKALVALESPEVRKSARSPEPAAPLGADEPAFERDDGSSAVPEPARVRPYERVRLNGDLSGQDLDTIPIGTLAARIADVVEAESPIHFEEVVHRLAEAIGIKRVAPGQRSALERACQRAVDSGAIRRDGDFLWEPAMQIPVLRDRCALPSSSKKPEWITAAEVGLAVEKVVADAYGIDAESVPARAAHLLGFSRSTEDLRRRIEAALASLLEEGRLIRRGDDLTLSPATPAAAGDTPSAPT